MLLVGDSLGMVVLGMADTTQVSMADMLHHLKAVVRAKPKAAVVADLPAHSYQTPAHAVENALKLIDTGADCVKLEGGVSMLPQIEAILAKGIPFIGHLGMLPQSVREEGGYKKKGKTSESAAALLADAVALDHAGVQAAVLESMVPSVAAQITQAVQFSTIGIGAGSDCDGQVLVTHDLLGSFPWFKPAFAKARADVAGEILRAVRDYITEVRRNY
jgi:3-methyl-2-oxobutanoate hydroxymethyltransferase